MGLRSRQSGGSETLLRGSARRSAHEPVVRVSSHSRQPLIAGVFDKENVFPALGANVGSGTDFMAMNSDNPHAERTVYRAGELARTTGVELGGVQELNEMAATENKKVPTDETYHVSAEDLADKIIALMQRGCNPLQLSRRTQVIFQTSRPVVAD
jgi:hypothetical protein